LSADRRWARTAGNATQNCEKPAALRGTTLEFSMNLEEGKTYKTRDGRKVTVEQRSNTYSLSPWRVTEQPGRVWICTSNGHFHSADCPSDLDIIGEWHDDGWIDWNGGECPVPSDTTVEVQFRNLSVSEATSADAWAWSHCDFVGDILRYRVVNEAPVAQAECSGNSKEPPVPDTVNEQPEGWIEWSGGDLPVRETTTVEIALRRGDGNVGQAGSFYWEHSDKSRDYDIVQYRIVSTDSAFKDVTDAELEQALKLLSPPFTHVNWEEGTATFATGPLAGWLSREDVLWEIDDRRVAALRVKYTDLLAAQAAGKKVQSRYPGVDWQDGIWGFDCAVSEFRLKPELFVRWFGMMKTPSGGFVFTNAHTSKNAASTFILNPDAKLIRMEIDPDTLDVISCTTESL
jgi:hypothetical protein